MTGKKDVAAIFLLTSLILAPCRAEIGAGFDAGTGVRALSFANNHAAVASDLSASYWNPAALALLPVREFQVSFDGLRVSGTSDFSGRGITIPPGAKSDAYIERMRLCGAGAMTAIPTVKGGLTLAFSFDRPFIFDDITVYTYEEGPETITLKGRRHGDLNRWSGAFGVQVTEQISAGLAVSLVTGKEDANIYQEARIGTLYSDYYNMDFNSRYLGYLLTGGLLYYPVDILKIGMRINAAMDIGVQEVQEGKWLDWDMDDNPYYASGISNAKGRAYCAPGVTVGAGVTFPWIIAALDLRLTMPYTFILPSEDIPDDVQARYYKCGAGVGFEVPMPTAPLVLRAGYSIDEYDLFPIIHKFGDEGINWELGKEFSVGRNRHTLSAGTAIFTSGLGFEFAYAYQTWGVEHRRNGQHLKQMYSNHRVAAAVIFRY